MHKGAERALCQCWFVWRAVGCSRQNQKSSLWWIRTSAHNAHALVEVVCKPFKTGHWRQTRVLAPSKKGRARIVPIFFFVTPPQTRHRRDNEGVLAGKRGVPGQDDGLPVPSTRIACTNSPSERQGGNFSRLAGRGGEEGREEGCCVAGCLLFGN